MTEELPAYAHNLGKVLNEWFEVSNLLYKDIGNLLDTYQDDWSSQPLRRMFVRSCWSLIEGDIYCVKQFTLRACELGGKILSADEHTFLSEVQMVADENGIVRQMDVHEGSLENLKGALKIATSKFELGWTPGFGNQGWSNLRRSLDLRNRITHPKTVVQLVILDDELNKHQRGFKWYQEMIIKFKESFSRRYQ